MDPRPNIALVPVEHDLDVTTVGALRASLDRLIEGGCRRIILNMAGASYVDSAGMAMVLAAIRQMRAVGGLLSLTNVSDRVLALMRRARLVDFVPVSGCAEADVPLDTDPSIQPLWRCVVPIDRADLSHTRARIARLLDRLPLTSDERFDVCLAIGEAMGNAVDHTRADGALVTVAGYPDRAIIEVVDCGEGFDPSEAGCAQGPDAHAERGRGIRLMRLLADSVTIEPRSSGCGMMVRIVKVARMAAG